MHFWLRDEVKPGEKRTALTPENTRKMIEAGHKISVERSTNRCFTDDEYAKTGCTLVDNASWTSAPADAVILGLKELPEDIQSLSHQHVFFAHCFKNQGGWKDVLSTFKRGNGGLFDLEFLTNEKGRRVAAFGYAAGFIGLGVGLLQWCEQQLKGSDSSLGPLSYYKSGDDMVDEVKRCLELVQKKNPSQALPSVFIIGALGRSGTGAKDFALACGIQADRLTLWDMAETAKGGPFEEILQADVLVNCIYLTRPIPPFFTNEFVQRPSRKTSVVVDVSCDTSNPHSPLPFYNEGTTFRNPVLKVINSEKSPDLLPLDVVAIDHLPSLIPRQSSVEFSDQLLPHLIEFNQTDVWSRAFNLYKEKLALLSEE